MTKITYKTETNPPPKVGQIFKDVDGGEYAYILAQWGAMYLIISLATGRVLTSSTHLESLDPEGLGIAPVNSVEITVS